MWGIFDIPFSYENIFKISHVTPTKITQNYTKYGGFYMEKWYFAIFLVIFLLRRFGICGVSKNRFPVDFGNFKEVFTSISMFSQSLRDSTEPLYTKKVIKAYEGKYTSI